MSVNPRVWKDELIISLKKSDCIRTGEFTLFSGKKSRHYIDIKRALLNWRLQYLINNLIEPYFADDTIYYAAGIGIGGALLVTGAISHVADLNGLLLRETDKEHGLRQELIGNSEIKGKVVILEDVITTGASIYKLIKVLLEYNYIIHQIICVVDREDILCDEILPYRDKIVSLLKLSELI